MTLNLYTHAIWGELTYQQVDYNWTQIQGQFNSFEGTFAAAFPKDNLTATTAPGANDDATAGYSAGSRWYDTVGGALYFCIDPTAGAAQWINTGFDTLGFGSAALAHLGTGPDEVPQNSDLGSAAYLSTGTGSGELLTVDDADSRYVSLSATILAGTGITVSGDWVAGWEIEADIGTPEELRAGDAGKLVDADTAYSAMEPVVSSGSGSWSPNLEAGRVFSRTLTGNSTLANPSNARVGQSGLLLIAQDGTGGKTLAYGSDWKAVDGPIVISTAANALNRFFYYVEGSGEIMLVYLGVRAA